ncbi:MAG: SDR family NAD(P)-dependent oxidoreductase [Blastocatellia bacterium]
MKTVTFSSELLKLFCQASHDKNPLHTNEIYARQTPYGEPVVFGVLAGLAALGFLPSQDKTLSSITMEFLHPVFVNIEYQVEINNSKKTEIKIYDGKKIITKITAEFSDVANNFISNSSQTPFASCIKARVWKNSDLMPEVAINGNYYASQDLIKEIINLLNLENKGVSPFHISVLMWTSYLVGMELPGEKALFSRLSLKFNHTQNISMPCFYQATITGFDERFDLLKYQAKLFFEDYLIAETDIRAFVRQPSPKNLEIFSNTSLYSNSLENKVALVIGASRGLGSTIAGYLATKNCKVIVNYLTSDDEAKNLKKSLGSLSENIILLPGDATNLNWVLSAKEHIIKEYGKLDLLVCNACPAILPLRLEPTAIERINSYVSKSLALVSVPLSVYVDEIKKTQGSMLVISSIFVNTTPVDWPHYVSAKYAIEGLIKVAANEYPAVKFLIARPPKLLTDQTNTPIGRQNAIPPSLVAAKLLQYLEDNIFDTNLKVIEDFA